MNYKELREKVIELSDSNDLNFKAKSTLINYLNKAELKQLNLCGVGNSSDKIVIELNDNELQIVTIAELLKMEDECMEFDGFIPWIERGKLISNK